MVESSLQGSSGIHRPRSDKRMYRSIGHISHLMILMIKLKALQNTQYHPKALFENTQARTEVIVATQDESRGCKIRDLSEEIVA